ncbi:MAG: 1-acyl-sn-glycerol-3-phosphate acyltransferase [Defluviicoccus sp.]|nr:MAG: 1-acyl-sn-glycerol-3-phosphate acyltransferase [Defluviicoccus sp.]
MTALRSALFAILAVLWTLVLGIAYLPLLVLPRRAMQRLAAFWCRGLIALARLCCGLRWRLEGAEYLPQGAAIIVSKHQSAWETLAFHLLFKDPVYVLKRELLALPLVGWYLRKTGNIAIDRAAGASALRRMLPAAQAALAHGSQLIVFPEGTRTLPGSRRRYQPGIAALYERAGAVPVVPVAVNSGLFWGRRKFLKYPGLITLQVLPPMPSGLSRAAFLAELEQRIETATDRLCTDAEPPSGSGPLHG